MFDCRIIIYILIRKAAILKEVKILLQINITWFLLTTGGKHWHA